MSKRTTHFFYIPKQSTPQPIPTHEDRYSWNPPHVGSVYRLEQLPEAVRALQSGQTVGKVVVGVDDGGFEAGQGAAEVMG